MVSSLLKFRLAASLVAAFASPLFPQAVITTAAGTEFIFPGDGRRAVDAPIAVVTGVAVTRSGDVYFSATTHAMVMRVNAAGVLTVVAGNGIRAFSGDGGRATSASLISPYGVAVDSASNLYIADADSNRVRRVTPDGVISTIAGNGNFGYSQDGVAAASTSLAYPVGIALDAAGNLYIADDGNNRIRKVAPDGTISTVAGNGQPGFSGDGGPATNASLNEPLGVAVDGVGNLYIADYQNSRVRKVALDGTITTVAGNGQAGYSGDGGPATAAALYEPAAVTVDVAGNLLIADSANNRIRKVTPTGIISTVAGTGVRGFSGDGGPAASARIGEPYGVVVDAAGNLFIADRQNFRIREVSGSIINTIAGNGAARFSGDTGPAAVATLDTPMGVGLDRAGNLYIADESNARIRKVSGDGVISSVAGNGQAGFSGDGGTALSASLDLPQAVVADAGGTLYIADVNNNRIRKVSPTGVISTVAGDGRAQYSGDGGPAIAASLNYPVGVVLDLAGNLYIADQNNYRVRKVAPSGAITTAAGNGQRGFSGDGGPATGASLDSPSGLAVDPAGNLYISDTFNHRIRKVTADGRISTFAGSGPVRLQGGGFRGDGGPATDALLNAPMGIALDGAGNLFIVDHFNSRIRRISPEGIITTVAGNGQFGFSGDGGPATSASINRANGIAVDAAGRIYIADSGNDRVRVILSAPPSFTASPASLSFSAASNGTAAAEQTVRLSSSLAGLPFLIAVNTSDGKAWLRATPATQLMPALLQVSADPTGLEPGAYSGTITITAPIASPPRLTVTVSFQVAPPLPPKLDADPAGLSFSFGQRSSGASDQIKVLNRGSGSLNFAAAANTISGGSWLAVTPGNGSVSASGPASLTVTANPGSLAAGTYVGRVSITSSTTQETLSVPVSMTVSGVPQTILLSQTGLTFTAVAAGGVVPAQRVEIVNSGQGVMNWTASTSTLPVSNGPVPNWLSVGSTGGSSDAASRAPAVEIRANPAGLPAGTYYGQVQVTATTADNSPQFVSVVLSVLPAGSNPGPLVQPKGLVFTGAAGGTSPGSQEILVANLTSSPIRFGSGRATVDGRNWFVHIPTNATVTPDQPTRILVQTDLAGLDAGALRGALTLVFDDGTARTVNVLLVVAPAAGTRKSVQVSQTACSPSKLLPIFTLLGSDFAVPTAWPSPLEARVVDDCGNALVNGAVLATFSNGDPPLALASLGDGRWSGTWVPRKTQDSSVTVGIFAKSPALQIEGTAQVTGALRTNVNPPVVGPSGVVSAASFAPRTPLAPGSLISIFGTKLSEGLGLSPALPLSIQLAGTQVAIAGRPVPLLFASENQVNAMLPFGIPVNTSFQLVMRRGGAYAAYESLAVAPAQPAIFTKDQSGKGQGVIVDIMNRYAEPGNPATARDAIVIYCSGLGAVDPPVPEGTAVPSSPLSRTINPVSLAIGGVSAEVFFAGLTPGFAGLYQVNAIVPDGVAPGDAVPVVLTVAGQVSPPVTISLR